MVIFRLSLSLGERLHVGIFEDLWCLITRKLNKNNRAVIFGKLLMLPNYENTVVSLASPAQLARAFLRIMVRAYFPRDFS